MCIQIRINFVVTTTWPVVGLHFCLSGSFLWLIKWLIQWSSWAWSNEGVLREWAQSATAAVVWGWTIARGCGLFVAPIDRRCCSSASILRIAVLALDYRERPPGWDATEMPALQMNYVSIVNLNGLWVPDCSNTSNFTWLAWLRSSSSDSMKRMASLTWLCSSWLAK